MSSNHTYDAVPFSTSDFLNEIRGRLPIDIRTQIEIDGAPDIELSEKTSGFGVDKLLEPLRLLTFPRSHLFDYSSLLGWILVGYADEEHDHDHAKVMYVSALYTYCYIMEPSITQAGLTPIALALLVESATCAGLEMCARASDFCTWALKEGQALDARDDAPAFHLRLSAAYLFTRCAAFLCGSLQETAKGITYYRDALTGDSSLPGRSAAKRWQALLTTRLAEDTERLAACSELPAALGIE